MHQYIDLPTGTLHWKDYGGSGPLFVLVHGLGGSAANWDVIGPRLTGRGRIAAIDLPGFGLSPPGQDWSLETHRDAVAGFVDAMGGSATLIGNSMGGLLSEMVAAARPDSISQLVLICPATPPRLPDPNIDWPMARRLLINSTPGVGTAVSKRMMSSMTPREMVNESLRRITHKPGRVPLSMVESFVELAEARQHFPWTVDAVPKTGRSIRRLFVHKSRFVSMIREIKAPTLVIQGVADPIVSPTSVEWLCWLRPDWTLRLLDDTGHTPQIDAPIRLLDVVETWLDGGLKQEMTA